MTGRLKDGRECFVKCEVGYNGDQPDQGGGYDGAQRANHQGHCRQDQHSTVLREISKPVLNQFARFVGIQRRLLSVSAGGVWRELVGSSQSGCLIRGWKTDS